VLSLSEIKPALNPLPHAAKAPGKGVVNARSVLADASVTA
jgi:hypothetical protein